MVYVIGSQPQASKNSSSDIPPMHEFRNCGMMKCVVTGSRSGTPPSSAVSIRCFEVMLIGRPSTARSLDGLKPNLTVLISKARKSSCSVLSATASLRPGSSMRFTSSAAATGADSRIVASVGLSGRFVDPQHRRAVRAGLERGDDDVVRGDLQESPALGQRAGVRGHRCGPAADG